jgi:L-amino acid N-acyltransferase YncA
MKIRDAVIEDLPAIVDIYNAAIPGRTATADLDPVSVESRRNWFGEHTPQYPLWLVEVEGTVRAWVSFQPFYGRPTYHATAEISVYVAPQSHRKGYGRELLKQAIQSAPELGFKTLLGFIFGHNEPSLALFRGLGFQDWARLPAIADLERIERDLLILGLRLKP